MSSTDPRTCPHEHSEPVDAGTVHVVTDLGPTEEPGLVVAAELLGPHVHGMRIWYYDPPETL